HVEADCAAHSLSGSVPVLIAPHTPSEPWPFFAAVHAWQRPVHALLQHTPSAQVRPAAQSLVTVQCLPCAQRVAHPATEPPQSMPVWEPFLLPESQLSCAKQPSGIRPQVLA